MTMTMTFFKSTINYKLYIVHCHCSLSLFIVIVIVIVHCHCSLFIVIVIVIVHCHCHCSLSLFIKKKRPLIVEIAFLPHIILSYKVSYSILV